MINIFMRKFIIILTLFIVLAVTYFLCVNPQTYPKIEMEDIDELENDRMVLEEIEYFRQLDEQLTNLMTITPPPSPPPPIIAIEPKGGGVEELKYSEREPEYPQINRLDPNLDVVADAVLLQLNLATIAFSVPEQTNISEPVVVQLLIDLSKTEKELTEMLERTSNRFSANVAVSKVVIANLESTGLNIKPITSIKQPLALSEPTEWLWSVEPESPGHYTLFLSISAVVKVDGDKETRQIKTFTKSLEVEITPKQWLKKWFDKNWQWAWSALLIPVVAFIFNRYNVKKRKITRK